MIVPSFPSVAIYPSAGGAPPTPWTPNDLSNLVAWFDPSDATTVTVSSNLVSQMDDKSGNGYHASNLVSTEQPQYTGVIGGKTCLLFDGGDKLVASGVGAALNGQSNASIFLICMTPSNTDQPMIGLNTSSDTGFIRVDSSGFGSFETNIFRGSAPFAGNPNTYATTNSAVANIDTLVGISANVVNQVRIFIDGSDETSTQRNTGSGTMSLSSFSIGSGRGGFFSNGGKIAEIIVTNDYLSLSDRQKVEGYLAHSWGLEIKLPGDHPYKTSPPTV